MECEHCKERIVTIPTKIPETGEVVCDSCYFRFKFAKEDADKHKEVICENETEG